MEKQKKKPVTRDEEYLAQLDHLEALGNELLDIKEAGGRLNVYYKKWESDEISDKAFIHDVNPLLKLLWTAIYEAGKSHNKLRDIIIPF